MQWLDSAGGPLVVIEQDILTTWGGCFPTSQNADSDYDRACRVEDYCGVITHQGRHILILGDEPHGTAVYESKQRHNLGSMTSCFMLVRWCYGKSEKATLAHLNQLTETNLKTNLIEPPKAFHISSTPLVLFDAATPGDDVAERLEIPLKVGTYSVSTYAYQPDDETSLLIHQFLSSH